MLLNVKQYGDPVLRAVSAPVEHVDDELKTLVENMLETMYATETVMKKAMTPTRMYTRL